jgi:hypothetical protein
VLVGFAILGAHLTLRSSYDQLEDYARKLDSVTRKLSDVSLVTKPSSETVTVDTAQVRPRVERQDAVSPPRVNTDSLDEALREVALGFDIPLTTVEASPASTTTPVVSMRRDTVYVDGFRSNVCEQLVSMVVCVG